MKEKIKQGCTNIVPRGQKNESSRRATGQRQTPIVSLWCRNVRSYSACNAQGKNNNESCLFRALLTKTLNGINWFICSLITFTITISIIMFTSFCLIYFILHSLTALDLSVASSWNNRIIYLEVRTQRGGHKIYLQGPYYQHEKGMKSIRPLILYIKPSKTGWNVSLVRSFLYEEYGESHPALVISRLKKIYIGY